jgi:hypothetical protein
MTQVGQQVSKPIYCRNVGCDVELCFDVNIRSKSGRLIPIEKSSGLKHQCKFSEYALKQTASTQPNDQVSAAVSKTDLIIQKLEHIEAMLNKVLEDGK